MLYLLVNDLLSKENIFAPSKLVNSLNYYERFFACFTVKLTIHGVILYEDSYIEWKLFFCRL